MHRDSRLDILGKYVARHGAGAWLSDYFDNRVGMVVVIPAYKEGGYLVKTLKCLFACTPPSCNVGVVVVLNCSERDSESIVQSHQSMASELRGKLKPEAPGWIDLKVIEAYGLRQKHFGAGLARKIGMDAACNFFYHVAKPGGVIISLDADTRVETSYLDAIEKWFASTGRAGGNIYFEHPLQGDEYPRVIYNAVTSYELHLRYVVQALRYAGYPYAFHSLGSAFAVRAISYAQAGGVPRKQAGEDFYFLQKLIPMGNFGEINTTAVFPSPRPSGRVIFGTGAAITSHVEGATDITLTYNISAFIDLKDFLLSANELYQLEPANHEQWAGKFSGPLRSFLLNSNILPKVETIKKDLSGHVNFTRRFFEVFNGFAVVKYLNYVHEHFLQKSPVFEASMALLELINQESDDLVEENDLLVLYRRIQRDTPC